jgi:hypothetical protein
MLTIGEIMKNNFVEFTDFTLPTAEAPDFSELIKTMKQKYTEMRANSICRFEHYFANKVPP